MRTAKPRTSATSNQRLLRVGRVISEVRSLQDDARLEEDDATSARLATMWQANEAKVKDDMIETLSVRIAQCTRENEHLKRAKASFDEALSAMAREKADVEAAFVRAVASAADEAVCLKTTSTEVS
ncbi:hypothetical protein SPRG_20563 [Saprolegnia parasitica CBS 223.65]|uniref:Uncharacterized protein n=1 Tax=Saprolegnia parasitica (strain CBS 223.65) TaxID=695850 RepID=A0A067C819_SAPPC|nr:hypothetical protein SPRG_20563 [Saprolegnia parasitica CBS 223.65]KDO26643.1 hypothetical protein SPRG_20563 [Saprolegnia parasitica CBS 223.65]|eukprot:XP_012202795.1 hypothetical protein SPRG_20563 [Saprolegnia parasitica CBS 223.65]